ncbi:MAG: hypothetical protein WCO42_07160 [bacterium]
MAHTALHFAAGMSVGMLLLTPRLINAWQTRLKLFDSVKNWLIGSWGLGFYAIIPSLLRHTCLPDGFCSGWWMNVFLLHPLINRYFHQHLILADFIFPGWIALQYLVILSAIIRLRNRQT